MSQGACFFDAPRKCWMVKLDYYDQIDKSITKLVEDDPEFGTQSQQLGDDGNPVVVHRIPDFVFDLKRVEVPFSSNVSFDLHLSKFKYERDFARGFTLENVPESLRKSLFPF